MTPPVCKSPVFIVGAPRSGTTILATALATHTSLWTSSESGYLLDLLGRSHVTTILAQARAQPTPTWIKSQNVSDEEFLGYLGLGVNALYTNRSGGKRWVEQTPVNTLMIDELAQLFPGALFIHLVRDGREVVHSMVNFLNTFEAARRDEMKHVIGEWTQDFGEACRSWAHYTELAVSFAQRQPDRATTMNYGDLVQDAEAGFREILGFLGEPYQEVCATRFAGRRINSSFDRERLGGRWRSWSAAQRRVFHEEAGPTMRSVGLELDDDFLVVR